MTQKEFKQHSALNLNAQNRDFTPLCLDADEIMQIAEMTVSGDQARQWLEHLTWCNYCLNNYNEVRHDMQAAARLQRQVIRDNVRDLPSETQRVFGWLSIFVGGWTLASVEAVCGEKVTGVAGIDESLQELITKRLVYTQFEEPMRRYALTEPAHALAVERFRGDDSEMIVRGSHFYHFLEQAEAGASALDGPEQKVWLDRLEAEQGNFEAALHWATLTLHHTELWQRMIAGLGRFWELRHRKEGLLWQKMLLGRPKVPKPSLARARAFRAAARSALDAGNFLLAATFGDESFATAQNLNDMQALADALNVLGAVAKEKGEIETARDHYERSLALFRRLENRRGIAIALNNLAILSFGMVRYEEARLLLEEGAELFRQVGDANMEAHTLNSLGAAAFRLNDLETAHDCFRKALVTFRDLRDFLGMASVLHSYGTVAMEIKDYETARGLLKDALQIFQQQQLPVHCAYGLEGLASLAAAEGQAQRAGVLFGAARRLRRETGALESPEELAVYAQSIESARDAQDGELYDTAFAEGEELALDDAVAYALRR